MTYKKATAEVILFDNSDVITASSCCKGNKGSSNHDNSPEHGWVEENGWMNNRPDRSRSHRNF